MGYISQKMWKKMAKHKN